MMRVRILYTNGKEKTHKEVKETTASDKELVLEFEDSSMSTIHNIKVQLKNVCEYEVIDDNLAEQIEKKEEKKVGFNV